MGTKARFRLAHPKLLNPTALNLEVASFRVFEVRFGADGPGHFRIRHGQRPQNPVANTPN